MNVLLSRLNAISLRYTFQPFHTSSSDFTPLQNRQLLLEAFGYQDYPSEAIQKPDTAALAQNLGIPPSLVTETYSHLHRWLPIRCPENRQEVSIEIVKTFSIAY